MTATLALAAAAPAAHAAFGDEFGISPVNSPGYQASPVFDGDRAFWAGACDRAGAPGIGADLGALGGVGSLPATVPAPGPVPDNLQVQVPAPDQLEHCMDFGAPPDQHITEVWNVPPAWRLPAEARAGSHADGSATFWFAKKGTSVDGSLDNIYVDLPPGFVGDPNATPKCTAEQFAVRPLLCRPETQVGVARLYLAGVTQTGANYNGATANEEIVPVYNLEPRRGNVAELGIAYLAGQGHVGGKGFVTARIVAKARTNGDFGVTSFVAQIPSALPVIGQAVTLWGVPWERANDIWRAPMGLSDLTDQDHCRAQPGTSAFADTLPYSGLNDECKVGYDPAWGPIRPFISVETDCNQAPITRLAVDSYQNPGAFTSEGDPLESDQDWKRASSQSPAVKDCGTLDFEPDIDFQATTSSADGASGLKVDLSIPQKVAPPLDEPTPDASPARVEEYVDGATAYWKSDEGRAVAHLKDTVVTLPPGVSVNPSAATGLEACDDSVIGVRQQGSPPLFNNTDPTDGRGGDDCPDGSKIGTVTVRTHLLEEPLTGDVVLGKPKSTDPASGQMFRMFLVLRNVERGLVAKIYGSATADPATGQLTATFANNPELPFERLQLELKGGPRGLLAMPPRCGSASWSTSFLPWSSVGAATPVAATPDGGAFPVDEGCANGFGPPLNAGMDTAKARANGTFSFRFSREEGEQRLSGLTAKLPRGLLASVRGLVGPNLCTDAEANDGSCPAASKIGTVDAKAGSGDPFVLEQKGEVFLTEGYKGGEYGLAVKVRPIAGPFRGDMELSPIIVRQAIHVDRGTAQVTAVSDPLPQVWHGVPVRVREVTVLVNRDRFMLNPSDCTAKSVDASILSADGAVADRSTQFQVSACAALPFKPKLKMRLTGRKQVRSFKHPGIRAQVTQQGVGEAGIERAKVTLPPALALDVNNAQALCEYQDGVKPDLENHCPKGSIVGRARATSPLLNDPLVGNVYFVKNIRRDPRTGNEIRTLPMVIAALRGEIAINLKGESSVDSRNRLVSTFASVPDAPVSRFNMSINGGRNGIIAVTRTKRALINLCAKPKGHIAEADMDGHNGRRHDADVRMSTPCTRQQVRKAQQVAKRAQAKRAAARRAARR